MKKCNIYLASKVDQSKFYGYLQILPAFSHY